MEILNGNFGVDKLKLHTDLFLVNDIKPLNIVPNRKKAGESSIELTPLFNSQGEIINGEKAYINTDQYNMTINNGKMYVEFNPSKQFHDSELTCNPNQIADVLKYIQTDLKEAHGIEADLFSTGISRIDMTAQAQMNRLVNDYKGIISGGKKSQRFKTTEYPSGYLTGNKTRQIMAYDKGLKLQIDEQIKLHINKPSALKPTNMLRLEARLLKSEGVQTHSQFKNIGHLLNADIDKCKHLYSKCVGDLLQIAQPKIEFIEMAILTDLVRTAYTTQKRGQWLLFLAMTLNKELPSINQFNEALRRLENEGIISRMHTYRMLKQYTELTHSTMFARAKYINDTANTFADQYNEIQDKLILPYRTA